jgi:complex III assembly factor LYRM7
MLAKGDSRTLLAARQSAREGFDLNRNLDPNDKAVTLGVQHALDVARLLRENIVQGKRAEVPDTDGKPIYSKT